MSEFTASNGIIVDHVRADNEWTVDPVALRGPYVRLTEQQMDALREFFVKENDDRLGRWRDPEDSVFVVYSGGAWDGVFSPIRVVAETNGASWLLDREDHEPNVPARVLAVARRFFAAHPEPKPAWHDAKPGEVWVLTFHVDALEAAAYVAGDITFRAADHGVPFDDPRIASGRRIWPEVQS